MSPIAFSMDVTIKKRRLNFQMHWLAVAFFLVSFHAASQNDRNYVPRKYYDASSKELLKYLRLQLEDEFFDPGIYETNPRIRTINSQRIRSITWAVGADYIIRDDSLEGFVNGVLRKLLKSNTLRIRNKDPRVLVIRDPFPNAACIRRIAGRKELTPNS